MAIDIVKNTKKKVEHSKKKLAGTITLTSYRKLAVNFLILTVNLIIIILYFSLSEAKVVIVPAKDTLEHSVDIAIVEDPQNAGTALAVAGSTTTVAVSHSQSFSIEATVTEDRNAEGTITIYNTTADRNQTFVANTRFANEAGIEIKTRQHLQIPPGGQIDVDAYASIPGASGEVGPHAGRFQVVALPHLRDRIYAEITESFSRGTVPVRELTPSACNDARARIEAALREKGWQLLAETTSDLPPAEELALEVTELASSANPGDTGIESFSMTASGTVSLFAYDERRVREIVEQELVKRVPPDKILVSFDEDSYTATVGVEDKTLTAHISASIQPKIPEAVLNQEDIIGMNEDEVREHFTKITGIRDVQVDFRPFWVRSVPNLKDHVTIEIKR